jgi:tetratricopeptide (TPR) repeat protein
MRLPIKRIIHPRSLVTSQKRVRVNIHVGRSWQPIPYNRNDRLANILQRNPKFIVQAWKRGLTMKRRLGLYLTVFMGLAVMIGYAFQEPRQLSEDQLNEARSKIIDSNLKMMGSSDRDQTNDLKAFAQEMKKFLKQCPDSEFAPAVQQLLKRVEENLGSGDFSIGQFYADRGNYAAALSRYKMIIENYPSFSRIDEVKKLYETLAPAKQPSNSPQEKTE